MGWLLEIALLCGAVWVLHRALRDVPLREIVLEVRSLPPGRIVPALGLTALGYLALGGYDLVALRYLRRSLSLGRVLLASFVGYALANNIPLSFFVGGSVRYRFYSKWGLAPGDTTALVLLNILTYTLGLVTAAALAFTLEPEAVPRLLSLPFASTRPLGLAALVAIGAYLAWSASRKRLKVARWSLEPPPLATSLLQIVVSLADWNLSAAALFVLLPGAHAFAYFGFFGLFILGQIAALITQLPGGLGVFEAVMVTTLAPAYRASAVFGALVAYRVIYFFLPLGIATVLLGGRELTRWRVQKAPRAKALK